MMRNHVKLFSKQYVRTPVSKCSLPPGSFPSVPPICHVSAVLRSPALGSDSPRAGAHTQVALRRGKLTRFSFLPFTFLLLSAVTDLQSKRAQRPLAECAMKPRVADDGMPVLTVALLPGPPVTPDP